jgi:hypothetical protein
MVNALERALAYINRGWSVVPVPHRSKRPIIDQWQSLRITAETAAPYFNGDPQNIGVMMGAASHDLTDIDLDCPEAIAVAPYILPQTCAIFGRPSNRASHWLYLTDLADTTDQAVIKLTDHDKRSLIEIRIGGGGLGAQTIFPGSTHESGEMIAWDEAGDPTKVNGNDLVRRVYLVAVASLLVRAWPAEGGRHDAALTVGGFLARAGLDRQTISLMVEAIAKAADDREWRDRVKAARDQADYHARTDQGRGYPKLVELTDEQTAKRIAGWLNYEEATAFSSASPPPSSASPPPPGSTTAFGFTWQPHWHGEADPLDTRPWLIELVLPQTGVGLISGQWGTYKTFVALDLAAATMTATPFVKFPVRRQGGVLFIACEGQSEIAIRLTAAIEARGLEAKAPFVWIDNCPRLLDPNAAKILAAIVQHEGERMSAEFGLPIVLVIIDTANAAAGYAKPGDENDSAVARRIMRDALATAAQDTGALFLSTAHFGKTIETGTRGSSAFEDNADVVLALLGEKDINGAVTNPRLCLRKRRTGPNGEEFSFRTKTVDMGTDGHGTAITTLTLEWLTDATRPNKGAQWAKSLRLLQQILTNVLADLGSEQQPYSDGPIVRAVDIELVRSEFYKSYPAAGDDKGQGRSSPQGIRSRHHRRQEPGLIGTRDIGQLTYVWLT